MSEFKFKLSLEIIEEPNYLLITHNIEPNSWGAYDNAPIVSVIDGITYVKIRLVENGESPESIECPLTKPEDAEYIEVTVVGVDEDGNELGEPQPGKGDKRW